MSTTSGIHFVRNILVVEDSQLVLKLLSHLFRQEPLFEPVFCASLAEAELLLETSPGQFFAAIADLNLPDSPNGEVVDVILAHKVPCIVLTGRYDERHRDELINKGVVDYIIKESQYSYDYVLRLLHRLVQNQNVKILVAEDSCVSRHYMCRVLSSQLFQPLQSTDGNETLRVLQAQNDIDLLILDHDMPGLLGFELVKRLRQQLKRHDLLILGVSADPQGILSARFIKHGADDFLRKPFCPEDLNCRVMAMLERRDLLRALQQAARYDSLTNLLNRRAFQEKAELHISLAQAQSQPISIALLDIDFFKNINDQMGHAGGDTALIAFAHALRTHFPQDIIGRLGGEEFALVSQSSEQELARRLDIFRKLCTRLNYLPNAPLLSFSAGVANLQTQALEPALHVADQRLYQAKRSGRGMTLCH